MTDHTAGLDYILRNAPGEFWSGRGWVTERALAQGYTSYDDAVAESTAIANREPDVPTPIEVKYRWGCERTPLTIDRRKD